MDKNTERLEAIGTIDELNSQIGFARSLITGYEDMDVLRHDLVLVQHDLFDLRGALSRPFAELLSQAHVNRLDTLATSLNAQLPDLKDFVLPGGSPAVGALHVARCVCRRAERRLLSSLDADPQPGHFRLTYLNGLSNFLFIAARTVGHSDGSEERYWQANNSLS